MRTDKYYGTNAMLYWLNEEFRNKYPNSHSQYRVVCKAKSMAEANRIAESLGLSPKIFSKAYTSETGNEFEIEMCDKYGFIICTGGTLGRDFLDIREALKSK